MAGGRVNKTDVVGQTYIIGEGTVAIPDGFKMVKYGAVKNGDYERKGGEWVEVDPKLIGTKAVLRDIMRRIDA